MMTHDPFQNYQAFGAYPRLALHGIPTLRQSVGKCRSTIVESGHWWIRLFIRNPSRELDCRARALLASRGLVSRFKL